MAGRAALGALAVLTTLAGCESGASTSDPGVSALVRVANAQFVPGAAPEGSDQGPKVRTLLADINRVFPGLRSSAFSGTVDRSARTVLLEGDGDTGFWIVPTGVIDGVDPLQRTFGATLAFSRDVPLGKYAVAVHPVDDSGLVGPTSRFTYQVSAVATHQGSLVVSLDWDNDSDLDLHLVLPNPDPARAAEEPTVEIWPKRRSSLRTTPGTPDDPNAVKRAAILDFDSNGQCVIDARREENITVEESPPSGHYVVRVDAFALCGQSSSRWKVTIYRNGEPRAEAIGVATPYDGYPAAGAGVMFGTDLRPGTAGAGQAAMEFDL